MNAPTQPALLEYRSRLTLPVLALALTLGLLWAPAGTTATIKLVPDDKPVARDARPATSFAAVVKKVSPNVVSVFVTKASRAGSLPPMFGNPFGGPGGDGGMAPRGEQGLGSGVILTEDGYILTNNHVVEGADEVKVVLADSQKEFTGKVIGTDPQTDIAVIKVEGEKLPAITISNSDNLEVGDVVLAVGNPFGVGQTVTTGIVSAMSRGGMGIVDYEDFIQTDASINPGNSGGALVDAEGRLVGINTAILSRSGGNQGVGFAVPINLARNVLEQLVNGGKVTRGFFGVNIQSVTPDLAREFKLPEPAGAVVTEVSPDSPAAEAGLKEGDVILKFNEKKVIDSRQLRLMVSQTSPGTKSTVVVFRDGQEKALTVKLGELRKEGLAQSGRESESGTAKGEALEGVEVADLDGRTRQQFKVPANLNGAVVTNVESNSPAASVGLQAGDIILEIDRKPVTNAGEAIELSNQAKSDRTLLRVWSRGGSRYVVVDASSKRR